MKKIQILGTGCAKCQKLATVADEAAKALGAPYELVKVTELKQIMSFKVLSTPALVVDGVVKLSGRVPTVEEAKQLLG
ncbi:MAG: TM0996/MTH895 family glutaredoxin-like protein [Opitutae bacterium]|nr:TM0996/MTH895 family glutaredoxin-like protein [Opitutae bacterium]